jgi:peptidylprolyl isomerase
MATDKRARKRAARAAREEELKARRNRRLIAVGVVLLIVLGLAFFSSRGNEAPDKPPQAGATQAEEGGAACDAEAPPEAEPQQYERPPEMELEAGVDYAAVITTSCGEIELDLLEKEAPVSVNNFIFLAREGFYDGLIWHRVVSNFVIQAGDPDGRNGRPPDDAGYSIEDEFPSKAKEYVYGVVAMANTGQPNSGGSQFFIVVHEPQGKPAGLQPLYSIFGKAEESSFETIDEIARQEVRGGDDPAQQDMPVVPVYIESIEIIER